MWDQKQQVQRTCTARDSESPRTPHACCIAMRVALCSTPATIPTRVGQAKLDKQLAASVDAAAAESKDGCDVVVASNRRFEAEHLKGCEGGWALAIVFDSSPSAFGCTEMGSWRELSSTCVVRCYTCSGHAQAAGTFLLLKNPDTYPLHSRQMAAAWRLRTRRPAAARWPASTTTWRGSGRSRRTRWRRSEQRPTRCVGGGDSHTVKQTVSINKQIPHAGTAGSRTLPASRSVVAAGLTATALSLPACAPSQALAAALAHVESLLPSHREDMALLEALDKALGAARARARAGLERGASGGAEVEAALARLELLMSAGDARLLLDGPAASAAPASGAAAGAAVRPPAGGTSSGPRAGAAGGAVAGVRAEPGEWASALLQATDALRLSLLRQAQVRGVKGACWRERLTMAYLGRWGLLPTCCLCARPDARPPTLTPSPGRPQALQCLSSTGLRPSGIDVRLRCLQPDAAEAAFFAADSCFGVSGDAAAGNSGGGASTAAGQARSPSPQAGAKKGCKPGSSGAAKRSSTDGSDRRTSAGGKDKRAGGSADGSGGGGGAAQQLAEEPAGVGSLFAQVAGVIDGCNSTVQELAGQYYSKKVRRA